MSHSSEKTSLRTTAAAVALAAGLGLGALGAATPAGAAVQTSQSTASSSTQGAVHATYNLLEAYAPVTFTVEGETVHGKVVGHGTTNDVGDVSIDYTPQGLPPGYYRLVATTDSGTSSSVAFSVT